MFANSSEKHLLLFAVGERLFVVCGLEDQIRHVHDAHNPFVVLIILVVFGVLIHEDKAVAIVNKDAVRRPVVYVHAENKIERFLLMQ